MKKTSLLALALLATGAILTTSACSNSKTDNGNDSSYMDDTAADSSPAAVDSIAALFKNPDKKSEVATDSTYAETESGLKYMILREGDGKSPTATSNVTVQYEGKLVDGTIFDSSYSRGEPAAFPLNRVIPGWTEGLQLMKENGKAVFYIPSAIGYGPQGMPPVIPPDADLIFTVELIKVD